MECGRPAPNHGSSIPSASICVICGQKRFSTSAHLFQINDMGKFSDTLMDHLMAPRNTGVMENPDLTGVAGSPGRGAFLVLCLRVRDRRIADAKFQTYGCGPTIAAGSMLTEMIVGRTVEECWEMTAEQLIEALDSVPPDKLHCPALAIGALRNAVGAGNEPGMKRDLATDETRINTDKKIGWVT
jgi:nitrogen fixation protein NifU and related proteins